MKKILLLAFTTSTILISGQALAYSSFNPQTFSDNHPAGYALQISSNVFGLARYTQDHTYTFGFGINPYLYHTSTTYTNNDQGESKTFGADIFARRNFVITNTLVWGAGLDLAGQKVHANPEAGYPHQTNSYSIAQYVALEYNATEHIYIAASVATVAYNKIIYTDPGSTSHNTYFLNGGNLQLSYLF